MPTFAETFPTVALFVGVLAIVLVAVKRGWL